MNIEFENPDSEIKQIKINPTDSLDEIAQKLLECRRKGIRAKVIINGVELDNYNFHSIEDIRTTYNQECQKITNESTNVSVGSFASGIENVQESQQTTGSSKYQSNNTSSQASENNQTRASEISETIHYIDVAPNESVEVVAQKLEACSSQGIKAVAIVNDITLNNIEVQSAKEIVAKYKEQEDVQKELNKAGIILEVGFRFESAFKVNARQIRVGKYDRIQEIIQKLQFCKAHGIEAYVNFNGVELNTYDYMKFRLNDPYRIMAWYNKEQDRLKAEAQNRQISAQALEERAKKTFFTEPIPGAHESPNSSIEQSKNIDLRSSFNEDSAYDKETPRMLAINGTTYKVGNKVDDTKLTPLQSDRIERRNLSSPVESQRDQKTERTAKARSQSQLENQQTQKKGQSSEEAIQIENNGTNTVTEMNTPFSFNAKVSESAPSEIKVQHKNKIALDSAKVPVTTKDQNALLYDPETRNMHRLENIAHHSEELDEEDEVIGESDSINADTTTPNDDSSSASAENNSESNPESGEAPVSTTPQSEDSTPAPKKKIPKELLTKIISFIAKHPYVLAVLGVILILLICILFFFSFNAGSAPEGSSSTSYSETCDAIDIHTTSFSRSDFIAKVQSYYAGKSGAYAKVFADNAGTIYDVATRNGINPEMVIVRAAREGYSPGTSYNYWGMGCTNTGNGKDCIKYKSFADGVLG
ncbi:MAG: hypothetical protein K2M17_05040, partial [Bacilli bacterium]|nr:hypothetical protein [Bacilli bacterium]